MVYKKAHVLEKRGCIMLIISRAARYCIKHCQTAPVCTVASPVPFSFILFSNLFVLSQCRHFEARAPAPGPSTSRPEASGMTDGRGQDGAKGRQDAPGSCCYQADGATGNRRDVQTITSAIKAGLEPTASYRRMYGYDSRKVYHAVEHDPIFTCVWRAVTYRFIRILKYLVGLMPSSSPHVALSTCPWVWIFPAVFLALCM